MRDMSKDLELATAYNEGFKTVNGMEACVTAPISLTYNGKSDNGFQNRKRYGGMRD